MTRLLPLAAMAELANGYPFDSGEFTDAGRTPLVRIRDLTAHEYTTYLDRDVSDRWRVRDGDVVIGMDGDFNVVRWSRGWAALNQRLCRLRPKPGADLRFVAYQLPAHLQRIRDTQFVTTVAHVSSGEINALRLWAPPLEEQRRVADFLDDQIARLDAAARAVDQVAKTMRERWAAWLEALLCQPDDTAVLGNLTDPSRPIQYGIVLPGPSVEDGVPIIKGGDVAAQRLRPDQLSRTAREIEAHYPRSRLVAGDLLIAIRGSVGELAVVPRELAGANITQDAARIAPLRCDGTWLRWVLQTPTVQARIAERVTGATIRGINIADLRRLPVPVVNGPEQSRLGQLVEARAFEHKAAVQAAADLRRLLDERKRVLITACVIGEFDVTSAS